MDDLPVTTRLLLLRLAAGNPRAGEEMNSHINGLRAQGLDRLADNLERRREVIEQARRLADDG